MSANAWSKCHTVKNLILKKQWLLQHDKNPKKTSNLKIYKIKFLERPLRLSDLNITENLLEDLKRAVCAQHSLKYLWTWKFLNKE